MLRRVPAAYRRRVVRRDQTTGRGVTGRALLTGGLLAALIAIGVPYGSMVVQGSRLGLSSATPAAFFLLFVLLGTVQVALGAMRREWAFGRGELVTIFAMMAVATAIPTRGVVGMLLPMITGTFYYATPENQWAELIHPHLADWMVVADHRGYPGLSTRACRARCADPLGRLVGALGALAGVLRGVLSWP